MAPTSIESSKPDSDNSGTGDITITADADADGTGNLTINPNVNFLVTGQTVNLSGANVTTSRITSKSGDINIEATVGNVTLGNRLVNSANDLNINATSGSITQNAGSTLAVTGAINLDFANEIVVNSTYLGSLVVEAGQRLGGSGTIAGEVIVQSSGTVAPGNSPGILTVDGDFTFADNSTFEVEIGGTTAGNTDTNHDQLNVVETSGQSFVTIGNNVTLANIQWNGFVPAVGDEFTIVNNEGTDAIVGEFVGLPEGTVISNFLGSGLDAHISYDGGDGNDVTLYVPNTLHWQGDVDSNWSEADNWLEGVAPQDFDYLVFDTATIGFADNFNPVNDLTGLVVNSLSIVDQDQVLVNNDFELQGNSISLAGGITFTNAASDFGGEIDFAGITLVGDQTFDIDQRFVNVRSPIDLQSHTLTFQSDRALVFGVISGAGNVVFDGGGQTTLYAANDYTGGTIARHNRHPDKPGPVRNRCDRDRRRQRRPPDSFRGDQHRASERQHFGV